jgi:hypothetical protein
MLEYKGLKNIGIIFMLIVLDKSKEIQIGQMLIYLHKNKRILNSILAGYKEIVLYYSGINKLEMKVGECLKHNLITKE